MLSYVSLGFGGLGYFGLYTLSKGLVIRPIPGNMTLKEKKLASFKIGSGSKILSNESRLLNLITIERLFPFKVF